MSTEAGPSNRRRMLSDTEIDDTTSEPSKRRRMPPPAELDDTASEGRVPSRGSPPPAPRRTVSKAIRTTPTLAFLFKGSKPSPHLAPTA
ncbi:hypothetical protein E4U34_004738 [Claviceps purpurea]|nr:hypothetical protein E4U34_004738 [Claviceps purpurea]